MKDVVWCLEYTIIDIDMKEGLNFLRNLRNSMEMDHILKTELAQSDCTRPYNDKLSNRHRSQFRWGRKQANF